MEQVKGLNAYKLKWIAIITMVIDHCYKMFAEFLWPVIGKFFHVGEVASSLILTSVCGIGCLTMPIFAYLIAEGCKYTHNKKLYIGRLFAFAIIAEIPFQMFANLVNVENISLKFEMTNILFTFVLGATACCGYQYLNDKNRNILKWCIPLLCAAIAYMLNTDYGAFGVLFTFIPFVVTNKKVKFLTLAGLIILYRGIIYPVEIIFTYGFFMNDLIYNAILFVYTMLSIPLLIAYNGKRGKKSKYFFYIFYPLHIFVLDLVFILFCR